MRFGLLKKLKRSRLSKWGVNTAAVGISRLNRVLPQGMRIHVFKKTRLGQIQEYQRDLDAARRACELSPENSQYRERLSRALVRLERWDEAAEALSRAVQSEEEFRFRTKTVDPAAKVWFELAQARVVAEDWAGAAEALGKAIDRSDFHRDTLFIDLGKVHLRIGDLERSMQAFRIACIERLAGGVFKRGVDRNLEAVRTRCYAVYYQSNARRDDVVVYETFHGKSVSCSPAAMLYAALEDPSFKGFTHVVVLNDGSRLPSQLVGREDVVVVGRESNRYRYFLCHAGHLINNNTFPSYFIRRPFQKYLNTWHGTPMKTLGIFVPGVVGEHRNAQHNFLQSSHMLSQNAFTTEKIIVAHDIPSCFSGRFAETGYPRVDAVLNATDEAKQQLKKRLGIRPDQRVVLYAPTWRGSLGSRGKENDWAIETLKALSTSHGGDAAVLYRGHHLAPDRDEVAGPASWVEPDDSIDTNHLLTICDVLVSDYSSVIFDFMPLRRPVVLYVFDRVEYGEIRGFFIEPEELGVPLCESAEQLVACVNAAVVGDDAATRRFCGLEDGQSTKRAMDFFYRDDLSFVSKRQDSRPSILFFGGGLKKNGVTISLLARLEAIDHEEYEVIVVSMTGNMDNDPDKRLHFGRIHPAVKVIDRGGKLCVTPLEYLLNQLSENDPDLSEPVQEIFARESLRVFGDLMSFDVAIDYGGYARFWSLFIGCTRARRKLIYLHNDMVAERDMRFPELNSVFACYPLFDGFVSVSASSAEVNRSSLAHFVGDKPDAFVHVPNPIDFESILERAEHEPEVLLAAPRKGASASGCSLRFVNVARLSPEKGHDRLLRAFARVYRDEPGISLYLVGDGPLRVRLEKTVCKLKLGGAVHVLGQADNPLPVVKASDVFIFSSIHEGQGLALIEALILDKTAVSTDIPGPHDVLANGLGLLVPDSEEGLVEGLLACIGGWSPPRRFDGAIYNTESEALFEKVLQAKN